MFASPTMTPFYLSLTAPPGCSTIRFRLATAFFLLGNALAGPLAPGVPPKLLLLRLVMGFALELCSQVSSFVTTVNPSALLTKGERFTVSVARLPPWHRQKFPFH